MELTFNGIPAALPSRTITEQNLINKTNEVQTLKDKNESLKIDLANQDQMMNEMKEELALLKEQFNDFKLNFAILKLQLKIERKFGHLFYLRQICIV